MRWGFKLSGKGRVGVNETQRRIQVEEMLEHVERYNYIIVRKPAVRSDLISWSSRAPDHQGVRAVCSLFAMTCNQEAIRRLYSSTGTPSAL